MAIRQIKVSSLLNLPTFSKEEFIPEQPAAPSAEQISVEYTVVAGGGGGGYGAGGGGGAGGVLRGTRTFTENAEFTISVGLGGAAGDATTKKGGNGTNSVLDNLTAVGGGGGGGNGNSNTVTDGVAPGSGGSGGGGFRKSFDYGLGTSGQGFSGGYSHQHHPSYWDSGAGGGGGGATSLGNSSSQDQYPYGGSGGNGIEVKYFSTTLFLAGGGSGGGALDRNTGGNIWGGGASNTNATAKTGSGGGGASTYYGSGYSFQSRAAGAGAGGIIILNVPKNYKATFSAGVSFYAVGPEISASSSNTVYVITAAGATDKVKFEKIALSSSGNRKFVAVKYALRSKKLSTKLDSVAASAIAQTISFSNKTLLTKKENHVPASLQVRDGRYLSKTFSASGNRRTWTFSCWVKRNYLNFEQCIFSCRASNSEKDRIRFNSSNQLVVDCFRSLPANGSKQTELISFDLFTDTTSWMHIVVAVDTTKATSTDRVKVYVNGKQITKFASVWYPGQNIETMTSSTSPHAIGMESGVGNYFYGDMAKVQFVDGSQLGPEVFGEYETLTGLWIPKVGFNVHYLVVGGGGGGGSAAGGGGGGGGVRTGFHLVEMINGPLQLTVGTGGAGGNASVATSKGTTGNNSIFGPITAAGGGGGGGAGAGDATQNPGQNGGSGGGANSLSTTVGLGNTPALSPRQGNNGGAGASSGTAAGGGGGGAVGIGFNATSGNGGNGGAGMPSEISGALVTYGGGGGGGVDGGTAGAGGAGGGASGATSSASAPANATANTGGGGGGGGGTSSGTGNGGNGASGVIILRYPSSISATFSAGVTQTTTTSSGYKTSVITAASSSDTVTFS